MPDGIAVEFGHDRSGTTATRPTNAPIGAIYFNTTTKTMQHVSASPSGTNTWSDAGDIGSQANTAGSGFDLSVAGTALGIFTDDGGNSLDTIDNARGIKSRMLLTVDQDGSSLRAIQGQLKVLDLVDFSTGIYAAVQGYVELAGDTSAETGSTLSCFDASLEVASGKTLTIDSGGEACGIHVETTGAGTITNSGNCAGVLIDKASGAPSWPDGILIDGPSVIMGARVGKFAGSAATTSAVLFSTAQNIYSDGQLSTVEIHGGSDTNLTSAFAAKCLRARHVVNVTTAAHETYGVMGQCVVKDTTLTHLHAGVIGTFEGHTSGVVINSAYAYGTAAILARVGGGGAITATKALSGVTAFWTGAAIASGAGGSHAFSVDDNGTTLWGSALTLKRATNLLTLPASGTAPVASGGTVGTHGTATLKIAIDIGGATYFLLASTVPTFT